MKNIYFKQIILYTCKIVEINFVCEVIFFLNQSPLDLQIRFKRKKL